MVLIYVILHIVLLSFFKPLNFNSKREELWANKRFYKAAYFDDSKFCDKNIIINKIKQRKGR